jgi:two-component system response regulator PilR (NtrC family)
MSRVLVVDDERSMREFLTILLRKQNYEVESVENAEGAMARLQEGGVDLVLTDLKLGGQSGLDVLEYVKEREPSVQVILMTAFATTETAIQALKAGARDYVIKPFKVDELLVQIEKALDVRRLERENLYLREELAGRVRLDRMVGRSGEMKRVFEMILRVAPTRTTVLITGESGTGKELVARALHSHSDRSEGPFVPVNCGAIPESLIESELFGHAKGSFTGASHDKKGVFAMADGGTIFLDEIGELPLAMQVRLLRVLQEKRVKPVGMATEVSVDCRVVAATNRDLKQMVTEGRFREDLYYRLNVIQIPLPALRERREDLPLLIQHFIDRFGREMGKGIRGVDKDAMSLLLGYPYDGNVRELENIVERAVTLETGDLVTVDSLPYHMQKGNDLAVFAADFEIPEDGVNLDQIVENLERSLITKALRRTNGVRKSAANLLGISFRSMRYRLDKYGIDADDLDEGSA